MKAALTLNRIRAFSIPLVEHALCWKFVKKSKTHLLQLMAVLVLFFLVARPAELHAQQYPGYSPIFTTECIKSEGVKEFTLTNKKTGVLYRKSTYAKEGLPIETTIDLEGYTVHEDYDQYGRIERIRRVYTDKKLTIVDFYFYVQSKDQIPKYDEIDWDRKALPSGAAEQTKSMFYILINGFGLQEEVIEYVYSEMNSSTIHYHYNAQLQLDSTIVRYGEVGKKEMMKEQFYYTWVAPTILESRRVSEFMAIEETSWTVYSPDGKTIVDMLYKEEELEAYTSKKTERSPNFTQNQIGRYFTNGQFTLTERIYANCTLPEKRHGFIVNYSYY